MTAFCHHAVFLFLAVLYSFAENVSGVSQIHYSLGFANAAFNQTRLNQGNPGGQSDNLLNLVSYQIAQLLQAANLVGEHLGGDLNTNFQLIHGLGAGYHKLIIRFNTVNAQ